MSSPAAVSFSYASRRFWRKSARATAPPRHSSRTNGSREESLGASFVLTSAPFLSLLAAPPGTLAMSASRRAVRSAAANVSASARARATFAGARSDAAPDASF